MEMGEVVALELGPMGLWLLGGAGCLAGATRKEKVHSRGRRRCRKEAPYLRDRPGGRLHVASGLALCGAVCPEAIIRRHPWHPAARLDADATNLAAVAGAKRTSPADCLLVAAWQQSQPGGQSSCCC